jgi:tetratricopeptide (TPR) repeat protein
MVMHYLLNQNKLPATGTYFGLVENQKLPVEQAIQQAYSISAAQLDATIKDYFHSVAASLRPEGSGQSGSKTAGAIQQFPTLIAAGDTGTGTVRVRDAEARALVDEATLRVPEHRDAAVHELETLANSPATDSAVAHRALAWAHLQKREYENAAENLATAADLDRHDFWTRYYLALLKYKQADDGKELFQGLPNMMQDLRAVLDLNPDLAEAYDLLALAQLQGGGINAALTSIRPAIQLTPRDQSYVLHLAHIYLAGKKWDQATALLDRLKDSPDEQVAATARRDLGDLPTLKKYGVLPQRPAAASPATPPAVVNSSGEESSSADESPAAPVEAAPDLRKAQYLKGRVLSVDCSQPPAAVLRVAAGAKTLRLRTEDFKTLLLVGADSFSCDWKNVPVAVNYKAGGKANGDLVSLEIQ